MLLFFIDDDRKYLNFYLKSRKIIISTFEGVDIDTYLLDEKILTIE